MIIALDKPNERGQDPYKMWSSMDVDTVLLTGQVTKHALPESDDAWILLIVHASKVMPDTLLSRTPPQNIDEAFVLERVRDVIGDRAKRVIDLLDRSRACCLLVSEQPYARGWSESGVIYCSAKSFPSGVSLAEHRSAVQRLNADIGRALLQHASSSSERRKLLQAAWRAFDQQSTDGGLHLGAEVISSASIMWLFVTGHELKDLTAEEHSALYEGRYRDCLSVRRSAEAMMEPVWWARSLAMPECQDPMWHSRIAECPTAEVRSLLETVYKHLPSSVAGASPRRSDATDGSAFRTEIPQAVLAVFRSIRRRLVEVVK